MAPQLFGDKRAATIEDPIVEPLWTGPRVLAFVDRGSVRLIDADGDAVEGHEDIGEALARRGRRGDGPDRGVPDARSRSRRAADLAGRDIVSVPKPGQAMTQMIIGVRGDRKERLAQEQTEARQRTLDGADDRLALVAVDLLWLDDESLCDVPLLERKRILESVVAESDLDPGRDPRQAADRHVARLVARRSASGGCPTSRRTAATCPARRTRRGPPRRSRSADRAGASHRTGQPAAGGRRVPRFGSSRRRSSRPAAHPTSEPPNRGADRPSTGQLARPTCQRRAAEPTDTQSANAASVVQGRPSAIGGTVSGCLPKD